MRHLPPAMSSEDIVAAVASLYERLPSGCKPGDREYSVLSAIVATVPADSSGEGAGPATVQVLSLGSGTKCAGKALVAQDAEGYVISDSHAEVIARRGLVRLLLECCLLLSRETADCTTSVASERLFPLERFRDEEKGTAYRLKGGWELALFVSENPCGDAAIMETGSSSSGAVERDAPAGTSGDSGHHEGGFDRQVPYAFTGAKVAADPSSSLDSWMREEGRQRVGVLRTKSGRSDIKTEHRSESHCCSDKICRWNFIGFQGGLLAHFVDDLFVRRILVLPDPSASSAAAQHRALERALVARLATTGNSSSSSSGGISDDNPAPPRVEVLSDVPPSFQKLHRKREPQAGAARLTPQGSNINWIMSSSRGGVTVGSSRAKAVAGGSIEVCESTTGALQGSTKSSAGKASSASRLCRRALAGLFEDIIVALGANDGPCLAGSGGRSYGERKAAAARYQRRKTALLRLDGFRSWIVRGAAVGAFSAAAGEGKRPLAPGAGEGGGKRKKTCG